MCLKTCTVARLCGGCDRELRLCHEFAERAVSAVWDRIQRHVLGWPTTPDDEATVLAALLEQSEYRDLPVVVMSTDMRAETRAWVAGRDNTAVLSWKEYQDLDGLLQRLIDVAPDDAGTFAAKFDNSDIHLLVVDDSATIRFSLQELFQMQGYQVTLASTQIEAMDLARRHSFDIAVLDFYLTETTGDLLCRELMGSAETGDIVCTVLTGTYSDHIIKRSLRAGAVNACSRTNRVNCC